MIASNTFTLRTYQREASDRSVAFLKSKSTKHGLLVLPTGCHAAGTGILMADGSIKTVETVTFDDRIMGPDGMPRTVLALCGGREMLYRITPRRGGTAFVVNAGHILSLISTNEGKKAVCPSHRRGGEQEFISVADYIGKSKSWKHLRKLHRSGPIEFNSRKTELPLPPWILGAILGDGSALNGSLSIVTADKEVVSEVTRFAQGWWLRIRTSRKKNNAAIALHFTKRSPVRNRMHANAAVIALRALQLYGVRCASKFIPESYKTASASVRLEVLAGLLDTDGCHNGLGGYDFISKSQRLASDLVFIARSLGLSAHESTEEKRDQKGRGGTYHRVSISGDTNRIPCRIARKKAPARLQKKNWLVTGFTVEVIGEGQYYGFRLSGDHLYLTSDFVVHHNSGKSLVIADIVKQLDAPCLVFQPSREILKQNFTKLMAYGFRPAVYCMEVSERILTADLRWIPCGDVRAGDKILAFSDDATRRWEIAEVTMSEPAMAECVRVHLSDGTSVVCTLNHPWLVNPAMKYSKSRKWVLAEGLMSGRRTPGWPQHSKERRGYHALRVCRPWETEQSNGAGWLAGIFDGEGSVSSSKRSGTRVTVAQLAGVVLERIESELTAFGFVFRKHSSKGKARSVFNVYLRGGFAEQLRFLGSIRPTRLIADLQRKWNGRRLLTPERIQVVGLEPVGLQKVQQITTSSGTYIGEGFLMHNSASLGKKQISMAVTLATIGSVSRNAADFDHVKYVLVDECHLVNAKAGMYSTFFQSFESRGLRILGLTATPYRLTSTMEGPILKFLTRTNPRVFSELVYFVQNGQLFRDGHLAKLEYFPIKGFDRSKLQSNSTGADYTDKSVQLQFKQMDFAGKLQRLVERLVEIKRKGVLVFTRFLDEARALVAAIPGAAIVSAETPDAERDRILKEFKAGIIHVVANVGVLTTGFDYPELDTVVLARPTMSLALYYQMVGRVVRPHSHKVSAMVIDMVGLVEQFGKVEDLRIECNSKKLYYVASNGKQLTNIVFGQGRY